jgi:hypothetical protein
MTNIKKRDCVVVAVPVQKFDVAQEGAGEPVPRAVVYWALIPLCRYAVYAPIISRAPFQTALGFAYAVFFHSLLPVGGDVTEPLPRRRGLIRGSKPFPPSLTFPCNPMLLAGLNSSNCYSIRSACLPPARISSTCCTDRTRNSRYWSPR